MSKRFSNNDTKTKLVTQPGDQTFSAKLPGFIPPQAIDLEKWILGAMLLDKNAVEHAVGCLKPYVFYRPEHQTIFTALQDMSRKGQTIDFATVTEKLRQMEKLEEVGGPYEIVKISNGVVSGPSIDTHCKIVLQKFAQREVIRIAGEALHLAYNDSTDPFELLDSVEAAFVNVGQTMAVDDMIKIDQAVIEAITKIEHWSTLESQITGIKSGFPSIDKATRGWQPGDLIVIAARPSVGKTAFALNLARAAALEGGVAVWSLEMQSYMLVMRMLSTQSKELLTRLLTGRLDNEQKAAVHKAGAELAKLEIYFNDQSHSNITQVKTKCRRLKKKGKLKLIIIDYLQLMSGEDDDKNREQQISKISRGLKNLAQELDVPVIALSQLSREVEKRASNVPNLSDIRESGAIEQDADMVGFLYAPTEAAMNDDSTLVTRRYFKIAKHRNGVLKTVELTFSDEIQSFEEFVKDALPSMPGNWKPVSLFEK